MAKLGLNQFDFADGPFRPPAARLLKAWEEERPEGLHQKRSIFLGHLEQLGRLRGVEGHRFFAKDGLFVFEAGQGVLKMKRVGGRHVNGLDLLVPGEFSVTSVRFGDAIRRCERPGTLDGSTSAGHHLARFGGFEVLGEFLCDAARGQNAPFQGLFITVRVWRGRSLGHSRFLWCGGSPKCSRWRRIPRWFSAP